MARTQFSAPTTPDGVAHLLTAGSTPAPVTASTSSTSTTQASLSDSDKLQLMNQAILLAGQVAPLRSTNVTPVTTQPSPTRPAPQARRPVGERSVRSSPARPAPQVQPPVGERSVDAPMQCARLDTSRSEEGPSEADYLRRGRRNDLSLGECDETASTPCTFPSPHGSLLAGPSYGRSAHAQGRLLDR